MIHEAFVRNEGRLRAAIESRDLTHFYAVWSTCMEDGMSQCAQSFKRGRGCINITQGPPSWAKLTQKQPATPAENGEAQPVGRALVVKRCMQHL
eukprot:3990964-Alexandrium_andersonii.AAC.1